MNEQVKMYKETNRVMNFLVAVSLFLTLLTAVQWGYIWFVLSRGCN